MTGARVTQIAANSVRSLNWIGDDLIDWCGGMKVYGLDGTKREARINYTYDFDAAVTSPSGKYSVIYKKLGTKGLLLRQGQLVRELNRSFYCANAYEYPVALARLRDGREVLVHCPDEYNQLEIEEIENGRRLIPGEARKPSDYFHSRLMIDPSGRWLISAGWVWHPWETPAIYDLERALADPDVIDKSSDAIPGGEVHAVAYAGDDLLIAWSAKEAETEDDGEQFEMKPCTIGMFSLSQMKLVAVQKVEEEIGMMMAVGTEHVVGFYEHPKLVHVPSGRVVARWPEISSGKQRGSINWHHEPVPPIALDSEHRRFAVAGEKQITVVELGQRLSE
jgi:hypothetical protein